MEATNLPSPRRSPPPFSAGGNEAGFTRAAVAQVRPASAATLKLGSPARVALAGLLLFTPGCVIARYRHADNTMFLAKFGLETKLGDLNVATSEGDTLRLTGLQDTVVITPAALATLLAAQRPTDPVTKPALLNVERGLAGTPAKTSALTP